MCVRHSSLVRKPSLYCADVSLVCGLFMYAMHHLFHLEIQNEFYFEVWNDFAPSMSDKSGGFCTLLRRTSSSCTFWEVLCSNQTPLGGICLVFFVFVFFLSPMPACICCLVVARTPTVNNQEDCWVESQVFFFFLLLNVSDLRNVNNWPFVCGSWCLLETFWMHVNLLRTEVSTGDSFLHLQVEKPESSPGLTRNVFLTWYVRTDWLLSLSGIFFFP